MNRKKLLFVFIIFILNFSIISAGQFDFRKTKWGMSKSQVKASEKAKFLDQSNDAIMYNSKLARMNVIIMYSFISNKLHSGIYVFKERHTNKNDYINDFNKIKKLLIQKYGRPIEDAKIWRNNLYKNSIQYHGMAVSMGHLVYRVQWKTAATEITHGLAGDNFKINHILQYGSKKLGKDSNKVKEKKTLDEL